MIPEKKLAWSEDTVVHRADQASKGARRLAREWAMSFLYQYELGVETTTKEPQDFARHFGIESPFFTTIVDGVLKNQAMIDHEIEEAAENWKLYRLSKVDLALMRIAAWELFFCPHTDLQVVLDEAIELAKEFGTQDSASFINGVLDRVSKVARPVATEPVLVDDLAS